MKKEAGIHAEPVATEMLFRRLLTEGPEPPAPRDAYERTLKDTLHRFTAGCQFQIISSAFRMFAAAEMKEGVGKLTTALRHAGCGQAAPLLLSFMGLDGRRLAVSQFARAAPASPTLYPGPTECHSFSAGGGPNRARVSRLDDAAR